MTESTPKKHLSLMDRYRELSGIYKLGFDMESVKGISLPFVAMIIPAILGIMIWKLL